MYNPDDFDASLNWPIKDDVLIEVLRSEHESYISPAPLTYSAPARQGRDRLRPNNYLSAATRLRVLRRLAISPARFLSQYFRFTSTGAPDETPANRSPSSLSKTLSF
jgi:hypothetical protein